MSIDLFQDINSNEKIGMNSIFYNCSYIKILDFDKYNHEIKVNDLKDNNRKIDKELDIKIILQIISGHMHTKAHVIFLDLNPNNIMLDYLFNVKLIDFD